MNAHEQLHQYFRDSCRNGTGSIKEAYELSLAAEKHYAAQEAEMVNLKEKIASQANMIDKLQVTNKILEADIVELKNEIEADYNKSEDQLLALEDKLQVKAGHVDLLRDEVRMLISACENNSGYEPSLSVYHYRIDEAQKALEQTKES